jgi:tetratricopeptide (TPR) repeat protein
MSDEIAACEAALAACTEPHHRADALNALSWALRDRDAPRALALAERAYALARSLDGKGYAQGMVYSLRNLVYMHTQLGSYNKVVAEVPEALALLQGEEWLDAQADILTCLGWCSGACGNHAEAAQHLARALELTRRLGDTQREAVTLNTQGSVYAWADENTQAVEILQQALALSQRFGVPREEAITLNNLAVVQAKTGLHEAALASAQTALRYAQAAGFADLEQATLDTIGDIWLRMGDLDGAEEALLRAWDLARQDRSTIAELVALLHLARVDHARGALPMARQRLEAALALAEPMGNIEEHHEIHALLADVLEALGDAAGALEHYKEFHAIREQVFYRTTDERISNLRMLHAMEGARQEAVIYQLRNVKLESEIAERRRAEEEREAVIAQLEKALAEVKALTGLLPICASCKKIRTDQGYWQHVEDYISHHTDARFSHGICPECAQRLYGEWLRPAEDDDTPVVTSH